MNHNINILKVADSCTIFDDIKFKDANFCIKTRFLNALLNRWESNFTQKDVANKLNISKRTVCELEKGNNNNVVLILNYIHYYGCNFAENNKLKNNKKYAWKLARKI